MAHLTAKLLSRGPLIEVRVAVTSAYRDVLKEAQNYHALIGRDLLSRCLLIYNGKEKTFTLAY